MTLWCTDSLTFALTYSTQSTAHQSGYYGSVLSPDGGTCNSGATIQLNT